MHDKSFRNKQDGKIQNEGGEGAIKASYYESVFYLAGYSIELALKAKVCQHLSIPDLYFGYPLLKGKVSEMLKVHCKYPIIRSPLI